MGCNPRGVQETLYKIRGTKPVLWTIPFRVLWRDGETEAEIWPAIPLLRQQQLAVNDLMKNIARPLNGMWAISRRQLKRNGDEVDTLDPEDVFSWEARRLATPAGEAIADRESQREFLDMVYQQGVGQSRAEVEYMWKHFCNAMLDWMINKEKPIDLFFAKLHLSPYRIDWKNRVRSSLIGGKRTAEFGRPIALARNERFQKVLRSTSLLVLDRDVCRRFIEVEHTGLWFKLIKQVETARFQALNPFGYAQYFSESVQGFSQTALRLYSEWMAHVRSACASVVEGDSAGTFRFSSNKGAKLNYGDWYKHRVVRAKAEYQRRKQREASKIVSKREMALAKKNECLQKLHSVQPNDKNVWNTWTDVPESKDGKG